MTPKPEIGRCSCGCGTECDWMCVHNPDEPCWGSVECVGEDLDEDGLIYGFVFSCEGHLPFHTIPRGQYIPEP